MVGTRWRILRLRGIPISVDVSWLIVLTLMTITLSRAFPIWLMAFFPEFPAPSEPVIWLMGLATALVFFVCLVLHELGHALVARSMGTPIEGITLFLFGGVAELGDEPSTAKHEFFMAIAGPVVTLFLAIGLGFLAWAGRELGWLPGLIVVFDALCLFNVSILLFNLVPAFPLDGGRVLRSFLWGATGNVRWATYWTALLGQVFGIALVAFGGYQLFRDHWMGGIWMALIGYFLNRTARSSYEQLMVREALNDAPVRSVMDPAPIVVSPELDLRHWVEDFVYPYHRKAFAVGTEEHAEGVIDTRVLDRIPATQWERHTVGEVMRRDLDALTVSPDTRSLEALAKLRRTQAARLLVTEGDRLVGIVGMKEFSSYLDLMLTPEVRSASTAWPRRWATNRSQVQQRG